MSNRTRLLEVLEHGARQHPNLVGVDLTGRLGLGHGLACDTQAGACELGPGRGEDEGHTLLVAAAFLVLANMLVDLAYAALDPRV